MLPRAGLGQPQQDDKREMQVVVALALVAGVARGLDPRTVAVHDAVVKLFEAPSSTSAAEAAAAEASACESRLGEMRRLASGGAYEEAVELSFRLAEFAAAHPARARRLGELHGACRADAPFVGRGGVSVEVKTPRDRLAAASGPTYESTAHVAAGAGGAVVHVPLVGARSRAFVDDGFLVGTLLDGAFVAAEAWRSMTREAGKESAILRCMRTNEIVPPRRPSRCAPSSSKPHAAQSSRRSHRLRSRAIRRCRPLPTTPIHGRASPSSVMISRR